MSDLSRLNPTPHAIAVYASQPLSPVATQHSLPSGRCPLLGPDFHRLDRTSLPGARSGRDAIFIAPPGVGRGTPNKATTERALIAARTVAEARGAGRKLAKEGRSE